MSPAFETVYRAQGGTGLRLERARVTGADGTAYDHHRLVAADGRVGAVIIATDGDALLLVKQFRVAIPRDTLELPRGFADTADGSPVDTGARELLEETGYVAAHASQLGTYVIDSSVYPQSVAVVHVTVDRRQQLAERDGEIASMLWVPLSDVAGLVRGGQLSDAHSLSAMAVAEASGVLRLDR